MISAYGLTDLIAEKFRALLQQVPRNRYRRQDIYDIAHLIERFALDESELVAILEASAKSAQRAASSRPSNQSAIRR